VFVIFKEGKKICVRPAYIGFIKNNKIRKPLMVLYVVPTLLVTIILNLLQVICWLLADVISAVIGPIIGMIKVPFWKYPVWDKPRDKK
jgi:hypothetical protein